MDSKRIQRAVTELLLAIGEDPARAGLVRTPERVAEAYEEFFGGLTEDPLALLADAVPVDDNGPGEAVVVRDITFRSICEHHLLPFLGVAHVAYLPRNRIVGLGRIPRVVDTLASRPQLQERLTEEIANTLEHGLDARGVLVVLDAVHGCVSARGSRQEAASTLTLASRGELADPVRRAEIISLLGRGGPVDD
ncbi:GTP cyclohydrolase I [Mycetocola miduiensis]|uniref:GTP cyclohydrolase 1 n=1 Tax=Mycetocola miduiensis TaxID=995034 RepID=A0A1I5B966_9MICO|nr:GTP cyclohydrolase I [Mycetocola miduiensis]SFN71268.1 GTP cyclohydrolase I [Mycetocola miduiensis]